MLNRPVAKVESSGDRVVKIVSILCILGCALLYVGFAGFGLVMSAFCFDSGDSPAAWQCFTGINLTVILPTLAAVIAGIVLVIMRRYVWAIAVAAIPLMLAALLWLVVIVGNLTYFR